MQNVARSGVELDMCPSCRGVWLDRGELEKILEGGREVRQAEVQSRERFDRELDSFHRDPDAWKRSHPYDSEHKRYRYDDDYHHKKKKKGFDIFDIFD
jgi:Zn-finger nucleic acid-binding protein